MPVTVAVVVPLARVTLRDVEFPFGPVVLELTLPALRVTLRVAVRPPEPVTVAVRVRCAEAPVASNSTAAAAIAIREFIFFSSFDLRPSSPRPLSS
jgi:hypothetical protein